jgi:hypothetical protein
MTTPYNKYPGTSSHKIKSILLKKDTSLNTTDIEINSFNDKDKSEALEKLNQLIQELELEEGSK